MALWNLIAGWHVWAVNISIPLALAVVATLGYVMGRRSVPSSSDVVVRSRRELRKAEQVARELERIAWVIRRNLARHHSSLERFKQRVAQLSAQGQETPWKELCAEAEAILVPTLRLATQLASAYDQVRQQANHLTTFAEVRTDPLTGLANRRGMDESLSAQFALKSRYETGFSLAIFDVDHFKQINDEQGHPYGDQVLQRLGRLLDDAARETDVAARYGGEEFLVVMPQTDLEGARLFADRIRRKVQQELRITVSGGVAAALDGDTPGSLMARADTALYAAKEAGRNLIVCHDGEQVLPPEEDHHALVAPGTAQG